MTVEGCPGRDSRKLTAESLKCARCGSAVEFFSDERRRGCPACGAGVTRGTLPSCADWCAAAEQCEKLGTRKEE